MTELVTPLQTGFQVPSTSLAPGTIFKKADGSLWEVLPNGDEQALGGGGSVPLGFAGLSVSDAVDLDADGGTYTVTLTKLEPPAWLDTDGNIILPGAYVFTMILQNLADPTAPGKVVSVNDDFLLGTQPWLADLFVGAPATLYWPVQDTFTLADADLPILAKGHVVMPTDATFRVTATCSLQRLFV